MKSNNLLETLKIEKNFLETDETQMWLLKVIEMFTHQKCLLIIHKVDDKLRSYQ